MFKNRTINTSKDSVEVPPLRVIRIPLADLVPAEHQRLIEAPRGFEALRKTLTAAYAPQVDMQRDGDDLVFALFQPEATGGERFDKKFGPGLEGFIRRRAAHIRW